MEVYVELTYCMNGILFIMTYEMISLLLNINWSFLKILFLSFLSNISIVLIYIDYLPYISFLYWIVLFLFIFKKQFFLYFPVFLIIEIIYLIYTKRKIKQKDDLYDVTLIFNNKIYHLSGFLDSGNHANYLGYPLIFIKKSKIDTYQQLDTLIIDGLKKRKIDIILVDQVLVNKQSLRNVYIGVLDELDYDCLLNKELMGGII